MTALYCSTAMVAFGPVFASEIEALAFLAWLGDEDPRRLTEVELDARETAWRRALDPGSLAGLTRAQIFFRVIRRARRAGFTGETAREYAWSIWEGHRWARRSA
jgi:hypothetical protein